MIGPCQKCAIWHRSPTCEHTNVGSVDEAEEIEQCDGRNDAEVNLPSKPGFGLWVEFDQSSSISVIWSDSVNSPVVLVGLTDR